MSFLLAWFAAVKANRAPDGAKAARGGAGGVRYSMDPAGLRR